jgi:hypothetical protein
VNSDVSGERQTLARDVPQVVVQNAADNLADALFVFHRAARVLHGQLAAMDFAAQRVRQGGAVMPAVQMPQHVTLQVRQTHRFVPEVRHPTGPN